MIKAVIFDIDNTLYSYTQAHRKAFPHLQDYMSKHFGWERERFLREHSEAQREITDELGDAAAIHNRLIRYQRILEKNSLPLYPHALKMYELYWGSLLDSMTISPGAAETMEALKKAGIRIGAGTDMTAFIQFKKLEKLGLLQYIDFLVSSEEAGVEKPEKALFMQCIRKAGVPADECLFVGDNPVKDYQGAVSAGMKACWYADNSTDGYEDLDRITDLREILLKVKADR